MFKELLKYFQIKKEKIMRHREGKLKGHKNLSLYYSYWLPDIAPKAILILIHGLAEHCGRYSNLVNYFVPKGYAVCTFDLRGHGKSEGPQCYVERFSDYTADLEVFYDMVRHEFGEVKIFLLGHSVGGTIATAYAISHQDGLAGLILSGPSLKAGSSITRLQIAMARVLSVIAPKLGVAVLEANAISRDKNVVEAYVKDPLVYRGKISARLGAELINVIEKQLPSKMSTISLPILIVYGTEDRLSNPLGCSMLYEKVKSKDKTLKRYEGFYHELFNEPEHEKVFREMEDWIVSRL